MQLEQLQRIHFIGIGGIGMSALARYFQHLGVEISGYDRVKTALTEQLSREGMDIHYVDEPMLLPEKLDLVVYTPAIPRTHKQLQHMQEQGLRLAKRAEVLGWISKARKVIGIAGTHGKTSTTSILSHLLRTGGTDCTAFLGGIALNFNSNFVQGDSEWVVIEADEFDRSFLHLHPEIAGVLSMDADHLDIYGDETSMQDTYRAFTQQLKAGGQLFYRADLPLEGGETFGLEQGQYQAFNLRTEAPYFVFDWKGPGFCYRDLRFAFPGRHNVENACLAMAIAKQLGASEAALREGLESFKGIYRRFEYQIREKDLVFIDDYAHHPTELQAAIRAARDLYPGRQLTGVFQPHLFSRTRDFAEGFAQTLAGLDEIILLDIYPAREEPIEGIDAAFLLNLIEHPRKQYCTKNDLLALLENKELEVLMTLGAGDIGAMVPTIAQKLKHKYQTQS